MSGRRQRIIANLLNIIVSKDAIMNLCNFGCNQPAIKLFKSGRYCCSDSSSSCPAMKSKNNPTKFHKNLLDWIAVQKDYDDGLSQGDLSKKYNVPISIIQKASKKKLLVMRSTSESVKNARLQGKGFLTAESIEKMADSARKRIIARYEAGWMPKAGRCKKYKHISPIAGEVYLDGTWELTVAKWLDLREYNWKRNTKRFLYTNLNGQSSYYTPDFWVEELGGYLEIKGYETALDKCKWSQFPESLTIWKKKEITNLEWSHNGIGADC
jgi:hypothetical protein